MYLLALDSISPKFELLFSRRRKNRLVGWFLPSLIHMLKACPSLTALDVSKGDASCPGMKGPAFWEPDEEWTCQDKVWACTAGQAQWLSAGHGGNWVLTGGRGELVRASRDGRCLSHVTFQSFPLKCPRGSLEKSLTSSGPCGGWISDVCHGHSLKESPEEHLLLQDPG